jgi:hypothetical protein
MYSKWIAKITPENIADLAEYCARLGSLTLDKLTREMESMAKTGQDAYLLVYNPESASTVSFSVVTGMEVKERYILIPVYHPEGHLQEFVNND